MATGAEAMLEELVQTIVTEVNPAQIVLFGSRARGENRPDADVDLLVVEDAAALEAQGRRKEAARIRRALWRFPVPIDVLLFSSKEVESWRTTTNHVIARALRQGRVLYDRP